MNLSIEDYKNKMILKNLYYKDLLFCAFVRADKSNVVYVFLGKERKRLYRPFNEILCSKLISDLFDEAKNECKAITNVSHFLARYDSFKSTNQELVQAIKDSIKKLYGDKIELFARLGADRLSVVKHFIETEIKKNVVLIENKIQIVQNGICTELPLLIIEQYEQIFLELFDEASMV